jgi:hypothetical protein
LPRLALFNFARQAHGVGWRHRFAVVKGFYMVSPAQGYFDYEDEKYDNIA